MIKINEDLGEYSDDWQVEKEALLAHFSLPSFDAVRVLITKIMEIADTANHHPTVTFDYNTIRIRTVTHESGDIITEKDVRLAQAISKAKLEIGG